MLLTRTLLACAVVSGAIVAQQQLLLPDNHHLSEGLAKTAGSANWWGTTVTGRRFQVLYEASHFINPAVAVGGGIVINELAFRGEDAEFNIGGQVYSNVTVDLYKSVLTNATMNFSTFATNTTGSVLLGTVTLPTVTVLPSLGTCPNTYCVVLPLAGMAALDPTGGSGPEINLLVDIKWTGYAANPAPLTQMIGTQDTTGAAAVVRGRGIYATTPTTLIGTASTLPPVIRVGFAGSGGATSLIPATVESYGGACGGSPSAFYQLFRHTENFDLSGRSLLLTPDVYPAPNFYIVSGGITPIDPAGHAGVPVSTADDSTVPFALSAPLGYPGGSTSSVRPSTNGYVVLDPASTETAGDFSASLAEYLGVSATNNYARLAPCWHDLHAGRNLATHPGSGLHAVNLASGVALITWYNVGSFDTATAGNEVHTMQVSIDPATGVIEFRFGANMQTSGDTLDDLLVGGDFVGSLTGFTRGRIAGIASVNPQSRDLSIEVPFATKVEGSSGNLGLAAVNAPVAAPPHYAGRMFAGQSITWNASNVPLGSLIGAQLLDFGATRPGLQFPGITAPGCMLSTTTGALLWQVNVLPGATVTGTVPFFVPPGFSGVSLYAQYVILDGVLTGGDLISASSNALKHTVGLQ